MIKTKKFLIIDSNALLHRAYHALPPLKTKKGELVNAVYGFLLVFLKAMKELKPNFVAAAFDMKGPTFRHKEFKEYKAKRVKAPDELYEQIPKIKEALGAFNVLIFEKQGFEADDIIGTLAELSERQQVYPKIETIIVSGDLDMLQLIDSNTKVYTLRKGLKDTVLYDKKGVEEKYEGLSPIQLLDFKGLRGDPSDNIPGVVGIGEKTAIQLIKEFGSLENLYQELEKGTEKSKKIKKGVLEKLRNQKEEAFLSKKLVEIQQNVPLEFKLKDCEFQLKDKEKIVKTLSKFEFYTLIKRIAEIFPSEDSKEQKTILFSIDKPSKESTRQEIEQLYQKGVLSKKIAQIEKLLIPIIKRMERDGIKIDKKNLEGLSQSLEKRIKKIEKEIYKKAGTDFNVNSPSQVAEVLFEKLKIPFQNLKKTPGGVVSTGAQELRKLKTFHPIINLILKYRELFKLKSGFVDALPKLIKPDDGRLHPNFHQLGTETGRMSCSEPNLQNIPTKGELGREIRKCFVPEIGFNFISADYSQMELRIAASISGDKKMIDFFKKGGDIHRFVASQIFNVAESEVTNELRNLAKTLDFGILYGMSAFGLAERAGISFEKAKEFIEEFFQDFSGIARYVEEAIKKAKKLGYSETLFGRKRFLPEIISIDKRIKKAAERMAINMPIQGFSADIIKTAMKEMQKQGILDNNCRLILQIHDELLFEVRNEKIKEVVPKIKKIMQDAVEIKVPLVVEIRTGKNWGELRDFI